MKDDQMMNQGTEDNGVQRKIINEQAFRSYWGQCCSKIVHDLMNPVNNRESKDTLEGNLYIVIF